MRYERMETGRFIERPNRFIAYVEIDGKKEIAHVKNTGRCREILVEGAKVYLEKSDNASRKYIYSLVAVYKGDMLINIDSSAPNRAVGEWLQNGGLFDNATLIKPEKTYGKSRFDFYAEHRERKTFIEVKGVTLERDGVVLFPDAPTERGSKHLLHLCECVKDGYEAYIIFVIQMKDVTHFEPNCKTDKAFSDNLKKAYECGVKVIAYDCEITEKTMEIRNEVKVKI